MGPIEMNFSKTMTIAQNQSLSGAIDLDGFTAVGFICPSAIEATTVALYFFASSAIDGTYTAVQRNGIDVSLTFAVNDYALFEKPADLFGVRFLKIRASTAADVAVAQATAARVFTIIAYDL